MMSRCLQRAFRVQGARGFATASTNHFANFPVTEVDTLSNGLRVASEEGSGETATVGVWIDTGSRYETEANNGVAHFLEHMFFKGTKTRRQDQLEVEIENMGGHLNAYTSREQTVFYAKVFKDDVPKAMEILSDILSSSNLSEAAIEREKDTILREMEEVENQTEEVVFDRLHETAYRNTALGRTILGPVENIRGMTRKMIVDYIESNYTAPRMVVAGAGAVSQKQLVDLSEKYFGGFPATPKNGVAPKIEPGHFTGSDLRHRIDDMEEAHIAIAFPVGGWTDPDTFPVMVMQQLLGSWDQSNQVGKHQRSPLISAVAEEHMAKSVMSFNTQYSDTGLFGVYLVAEPLAVNDLMYNVINEITRLCYEVDETHLEQAKQQLLVTLMANMDGSTQICEDIGRQMLSYGRRMHPSEVHARVSAVDVVAVKAAAKRFIFDQDYALAGIGSLHELQDYVYFRRRTYWLRY